MSNPIKAAITSEAIDEAFFEKFDNGSLLLRSWEAVRTALEFIENGARPCDAEEAYNGLITTHYALRVMFRRDTGADAMSVSDGDWYGVARGYMEPATTPEEVARNRAIVDFVMMNDADNPDWGTLQ